MHAQQRGNVLAVARVPARCQIQGMEPLSLLEVGFAFHALLQLVGTFGNPRQCFSHSSPPPLGWTTEENGRKMDNRQSETIYGHGPVALSLSRRRQIRRDH